MDDTAKKEITNRLRSIQGHVQGIERMINEEAYCVDILKQTLAVQRALERVNGLVLDRHLNRCVTDILRSNDVGERQRVIGEILDLFESRRGA